MGNAKDIKGLSINPEELVVVSRTEFVPGTNSQVDVFLKLSEKNFVMILKEGTKINFDEMHFPDKAEWLYVRKKDYHKCVGRALAVAGIIMDTDGISMEKKTAVLSRAADSIFKEIEHLGFNEQSLEHSKIVSKSIESLVSSKPDLEAVITMMDKLNDQLIRHSMMVSAVSVIIARAMKWTMTQNIEKLALGALLHDVGMKELPEEILETPRHAMTREQLAIYESHVYRGVEILRTMPSISDDIISMALEHHENAAGQGYPRRVRDFKMNPFARIVALADCFSELVMNSVNNPVAKDAGEAIHFIEEVMGQPYHKPAFAALKSAFNQAKG